MFLIFSMLSRVSTVRFTKVHEDRSTNRMRGRSLGRQLRRGDGVLDIVHRRSRL